MNKGCGSEGSSLNSVEQVIDRHESFLFGIEGVHGIGIGNRGKQRSIQVFVRPGVNFANVLPATLEDVPVDVIVMPAFDVG